MSGINAFGGDLPDTQKVDQEKIDKASEEEAKVREQWRAYTRARDAGHLDYVEDARKFDAYYCGDQWDPATKQVLDSQKRPAHTINLVLSTVNAVIGEYISSRQEIGFKPAGKGASLQTANSLRFLFKQIANNNKSQWNEQTVFQDGLVQDRGYFYYSLDFSDNLEGEVREEVFAPTDVIPDPGAQDYNPDTWAEFFISRWMTPEEIGAKYGEEFSEKLGALDAVDSFGHDSIEWEAPTFAGTYHDSNVLDTDLEEVVRVKRVRVIERQYRKLARTMFFVDPVVSDMRRVPEGWDKIRAATFAATHGLQIIWKPERRIRVCVTADRVLLHDNWSLFDKFSIVPYFPYFRRGRPFGLVRNLIDPQDMLNKVTSQELHVVNTTANSGWKFESGSLVNMDADDLAAFGAMSGLVLEYTQGSTAPEKIQPNQIPTGLDAISNKAGVFFREISGVNEAMLGMGASNSSLALGEQRRSALTQQEIIFDHLNKTRQLRAEMILHIVQRYYNETRLLQIFEKNEDGDEEEVLLELNQPTPEGDIVNDLTLGEYSVVISSVPRTEAYEDSVFQQLKELRELGVPIPDHILVEHTNLEGRQEVAEILKKISGLAAPTEEEVQINQMLQEIQMRMAMAELRDLEASAMEREARARKLAAEAGMVELQPQLDQVKLGAELRNNLMTKQIDQAINRDDLFARLKISADKNATIERVAQIDSMTKRVGGKLDRNAKLEQTLLALREGRAARERSRTSDNNPPTKA